MGKSKAWYLLPILMGIIGGIIMYFVIKNEEPDMAKNGLILGVLLTVVGLALQFAVSGIILV